MGGRETAQCPERENRASFPQLEFPFSNVDSAIRRITTSAGSEAARFQPGFEQLRPDADDGIAGRETVSVLRTGLEQVQLHTNARFSHCRRELQAVLDRNRGVVFRV